MIIDRVAAELTHGRLARAGHKRDHHHLCEGLVPHRHLIGGWVWWRQGIIVRGRPTRR